MPLPSIRRFYTEDYPTSTDWFKRFIGQLNLFVDPTYNLLNRGLTFPQNVNAQLYTFTLTAGATSDLNTVRFTSTVAGKPTGLIKVACNLTSNITSPVTSAVDISSWYVNGNQIVITAISGLTAGQTYTLTVLLF